ncbi:hypothetical protein [Streptomyces sp. NBRC 109706]|uniref:hypothetical protein n=1 Tax=Streptomyces sp. NBRC 109706 TaxID=1550035 RepID=UPI0007824FA6|nr:hypothetical protein [Streptomyces sp. NBRC 109706]
MIPPATAPSAPGAGEEHARVGRLAADAGISLLVTVGGDDARVMVDAPKQARPGLEIVESRDRDHALTVARELLRPGGVVLVKSSHSVGLEHVAVCLAQPDPVSDGR